jgi:hypothetical protein
MMTPSGSIVACMTIRQVKKCKAIHIELLKPCCSLDLHTTVKYIRRMAIPRRPGRSLTYPLTAQFEASLFTVWIMP